MVQNIEQTKLLSERRTKSGFFVKRNLLWWYGDLLSAFGLIFWVISLNQNLLSGVLNWAYAGNLIFTTENLIASQFTMAIGSAIMIGWGITIMAIASHYTETMRIYFVVGILSWFIFDNITSLIFGFYLNLALNLIFLAFAVIVAFATPTIEKLSKPQIDQEDQ